MVKGKPKGGEEMSEKIPAEVKNELTK